MTFDPMKFYDDGQRRQKRYDSLVPVFVVAVVLLVVFGAGFVAYQRSHVKPKPEQSRSAREIVGTHWQATDPPLMSQCPNGGWYVTNLADCKTPGFSGSFMVPLGRPRKHKRKAGVFHVFTYYASPAFYNSHSHVTLKQLAKYQQENPSPICILNIAGECWVTLDSDPAPTPTDDVRLEVRPSTHPATEWSHETMLQYVFTKEQASRLGNEWIKQCGPDNHEQACYTPGKPDCLLGGSVDGSIPPCGQAEKAAEYDQLVLDHSDDFYDNVFVPGGECTDRERYRELQCQMGGKCLLRNLDSKNWCPVVEWHIDPPAKPDCKMPADVDVCPQTLDPKAVDDKKAKP